MNPAQNPDILDVIDLRELIRKLWRRKGIIIGTAVLLTVLSIIVLFLLTPLYTGETYVLIEPRDSKVVDFEAVLAGLWTLAS